jgi:hypothetical protein
MSRVENIIDVVRQSLTARGIGQEVIQNVPFLVQRSIIELQRKQVLPPVSLEFTVEDAKEERRNATGDLMYNYFKLPDDFAELSELYVEGKKPYHYTNKINYLTSKKKGPTEESSGSFSIEKLNLENGTLPVFIMPIDPFPEDGRYVKLTYFADGSTTDFDWIRPEHWEAVISQVESFMGLIRPDMAEDRAYEVATRWKNAQGRQHVNRTMIRTSMGGLFGK